MKYLVILISLHIFIFFNCILQAQWVQTNGPEGAMVNCLATNGYYTIAGTEGLCGNFFISTNNGTNWTEADNNLICKSINALVFSGNNIFAGTDSGIYLSTKNGANWVQVNNGLTRTDNKYVYALAVNGMYLFAATDYGVYLSTNDGASWTAVNNGLSNEARYTSFAISGNNIFVGALGINSNGGGCISQPIMGILGIR